MVKFGDEEFKKLRDCDMVAGEFEGIGGSPTRGTGLITSEL